MLALLKRLMAMAAPPRWAGVVVPYASGAWARPWILAEGEWDDTGVWRDGDVWID